MFSSTLGAADPWLATAARHSSGGAVYGASTPSTFTAAHVPGTSWRMVIAIPDSRLFASIDGWTRYVPWLIFALVTLLGALILVLCAHLLADRARLRALSGVMERTAQTDSLTDLYNRRALTEQLTRAAARARRHEEPLSVLMIDLDRFKQTNDSFGHEAGDQVLCTIADCMREVLRADDVYGRWGGDEFLVVLPKTGAQWRIRDGNATARSRRAHRPARHRPARRCRAERRRRNGHAARTRTISCVRPISSCIGRRPAGVLRHRSRRSETAEPSARAATLRR